MQGEEGPVHDVRHLEREIREVAEEMKQQIIDFTGLEARLD